MLTIERLREVLHYDPSTGVWTWLADRQWSDRNRREVRIGLPAGRVSNGGYLIIGIDGKPYSAGALAFFYMTRIWPEADVDHENLDRSDNRWLNLRSATRPQNMANKRAQRNNKSGLKGVSWNKPAGRWLAQIQINGKVKNLGRFIDKHEAHARYLEAARRAFGEFARAS